ncbi:hypothetical protein Btru_041672 [Bulinus truncatus]|nr:hypothetical protein Btru_041672 [Bulinus truncatus]
MKSCSSSWTTVLTRAKWGSPGRIFPPQGGSTVLARKASLVSQKALDRVADLELQCPINRGLITNWDEDESAGHSCLKHGRDGGGVTSVGAYLRGLQHRRGGGQDGLGGSDVTEYLIKLLAGDQTLLVVRYNLIPLFFPKKPGPSVTTTQPMSAGPLHRLSTPPYSGYPPTAPQPQQPIMAQQQQMNNSQPTTKHHHYHSSRGRGTLPQREWSSGLYDLLNDTGFVSD